MYQKTSFELVRELKNFDRTKNYNRQYGNFIVDPVDSFPN